MTESVTERAQLSRSIEVVSYFFLCFYCFTCKQVFPQAFRTYSYAFKYISLFHIQFFYYYYYFRVFLPSIYV